MTQEIQKGNGNGKRKKKEIEMKEIKIEKKDLKKLGF